MPRANQSWDQNHELRKIIMTRTLCRSTLWRPFQFLLLAFAGALSPLSANEIQLPARETPIPRTTDGVPHVQIDVQAVPEISQELLRRVEAIGGIEIQNSIVSLPGALGFWVKEHVPLARPDVIVRGREFAHIHPDGSLHATLSPALASQAVRANWAVYHPWANQRRGWEGFVMIFTPSSKDELEVVLELVRQSFEFVTGSAAGAM